MTNPDRRTRLAQAGQWLRATRERRGYNTQVDLASALGVDKSLVSNYERGVSAVDDDRAAQIAQLLRMDLIEVRRGLGLWVPDDGPPERQDLEGVSTDDLVELSLRIARQYPDDPLILHAVQLLITVAQERGQNRSRRTG